MKITITDLRKRYGDVVALDGPSFTIPSGSTFGVLGTNGAGKTTLFELLVGHDEPDDGTIEVGDLDVREAGHRVRERVAFLPEHAGFPDAMTGREVLEVHARIRGLGDRQRRIADALETVGLADAADRAVEGYSNGMGRRLGLAATLLPEPPVLVLDEPTAGLDPRGVATFHEIIERIGRETDATVVLSSHVLGEVERLCDEVAILQDGQLRAAGPVDELRADAGDGVTVSIHPATGARERLLEAVGEWEEATVTVAANGTAGETVEVVCDRETAFDRLSTLEGELIDRFEVREPGLEAAFHDAIAGEGDAAIADDGDRSTAEVTAR
ncbi:Cu-processing system ATP-binding protein [Halobiforma haloterrestris]|uniref:Cu-processing system ATP-binding protein n=1 Tax=Natronobacterium haloterrestre TaxID=148448 RepID=A0A1I1CZD2_NATHA|nr:ABC transporter ATP-binding protein [Halobiforma haloterrestris]SFB67426.1 Cu-processing system ATP-binding protein [Halobiforma haloterrestris]